MWPGLAANAASQTVRIEELNRSAEVPDDTWVLPLDIERLLALRAVGLERFVVVGPGFSPPEWGEAGKLFVKEVIPALRAAI